MIHILQNFLIWISYQVYGLVDNFQRNLDYYSKDNDITIFDCKLSNANPLSFSCKGYSLYDCDRLITPAPPSTTPSTFTLLPTQSFNLPGLESIAQFQNRKLEVNIRCNFDN